MYKKLKVTLVILSFALTSLADAHGEDKPGPHNGYVRMPGAYHVEVVPKENKLEIMLLDINFKNPTVLNSHVKASIQTGKKITKLKCKADINYFSCAVNHQMLSKPGTLFIESERQLAEGMTVSYPLPLHLEKH